MTSTEERAAEILAELRAEGEATRADIAATLAAAARAMSERVILEDLAPEEARTVLGLMCSFVPPSAAEALLAQTLRVFDARLGELAAARGEIGGGTA